MTPPPGAWLTVAPARPGQVLGERHRFAGRQGQPPYGEGEFHGPTG
ncbi:hypothetical protein SLNHY_0722 [Streptomyces albus]|nr:hypothetical protein SLNHY_0722 [Streptomyces albus]